MITTDKLRIVETNSVQGFGKDVREIVRTDTNNIIGYLSKVNGVQSIFVPRPASVDDIVAAISMLKDQR